MKDKKAEALLRVIQANHREVEYELRRLDDNVERVTQLADVITVWYYDGSRRDFTTNEWFDSSLPVLKFLETVPRLGLIH